MRDYDMERFLMHYGVGRSGGGKTGTNRPKGLHYKTRGSTSLYANRQRQMHGEDNGDDSESTGNKFLDIRKNQEKQAKEAKKTKEQIEKYRRDKWVDEYASKFFNTRETRHRPHYQEEVNSRKLGNTKKRDDYLKKTKNFRDIRKNQEEALKTANQIEKYRKDKAEDEKWAKVRQEAKRKEENKQKFLDIRNNQEKQAEIAKKQKRVKEQQSRNEFNKSVLALIDNNRAERKSEKLQKLKKKKTSSSKYGRSRQD